MLTRKEPGSAKSAKSSASRSRSRGRGAKHGANRGATPGTGQSSIVDLDPEQGSANEPAGATSAANDSLQVVPTNIVSSTHKGIIRTMSARTLPLYRCSSLLEFPTAALLLYPIEMILNIPPSDRTHEGHIRDSSRRRRFLHVIKRTVESGTVSISQIVYVTPAAS